MRREISLNFTLFEINIILVRVADLNQRAGVKKWKQTSCLWVVVATWGMLTASLITNHSHYVCYLWRLLPAPAPAPRQPLDIGHPEHVPGLLLSTSMFPLHEALVNVQTRANKQINPPLLQLAAPRGRQCPLGYIMLVLGPSLLLSINDTDYTWEY